jgi:hypothetical protein
MLRYLKLFFFGAFEFFTEHSNKFSQTVCLTDTNYYSSLPTPSPGGQLQLKGMLI